MFVKARSSSNKKGPTVDASNRRTLNLSPVQMRVGHAASLVTSDKRSVQSIDAQDTARFQPQYLVVSLSN